MALDIQKIKPIVKKLAQNGLFWLFFLALKRPEKYTKSDVDIAFYSDKK